MTRTILINSSKKLLIMDSASEKRIATLHPSVRMEMKVIVNEINQNLSGRSQVRIAQALRTFKEQNDLYNQPHDHKDNDGDGKIDEKDECVTRAKGGQSVHNYGFAVDIVLIIDGKVASWDTKKDWDGDKVADWDECVKVFAKYGWSWGGNWTSFKDMPHFDKIGFGNWRVLATKKMGADGYIII